MHTLVYKRFKIASEKFHQKASNGKVYRSFVSIAQAASFCAILEKRHTFTLN
jgi:hypothetical protein